MQSTRRKYRRPQGLNFFPEQDGHNHQIVFTPDDTVSSYPAIQDVLTPAESYDTANIGTPMRFSNLSSSLHSSHETTSTLTEQDVAAMPTKDEGEPAAPPTVGFFSSSLSKTRLAVLLKYSQTREQIILITSPPELTS
jgi:hypothetical protein